MNWIGTTCRGWLACGLAGWAALSGVPQSAQGALIVDMQAVSATGATLTNSKTISNATVGAVITFNIIAQVTGIDAGLPEGLTSLAGGFYTQNGGPMRGNVTNVLLNSTFAAGGSTIGTANNGLALGDTDGDIDWGGTSNASATGWYSARAVALVSGASHLIGTMDLVLTSVSPGEMSFNFVPRVAGTAANWVQDGVTTSPTTGTYAAGTAVSITAVPEPSTYVLAGVLLAGWAIRRRSRTA